MTTPIATHTGVQEPDSRRALVRRLFEAVDGRRWEVLEELFHPEAVYERPGYGPLVGRDAIMAFYRGVRRISSGVHHLEGVLATADAAAAWGRFIGELHDGSTADERFSDVYAISDDRIRWRRTHFFRAAI